jgi:fibronectin-binding autotransporter adhesin
MTPKIILSQILFGTALVFTANGQQSLTWDPAADGSGSGGAGAWGIGSPANWYNGSADVAWSDNSSNGTNTAIFGGTGGTVTLNSSLSASNLVFNVTGYTLSGSGTLTLGAGGINASSLSSGNTTIGNALALPAAQQPWQAGSGGTLTVEGNITRSLGASVDFSSSGVSTTNLLNDGTGVIGGWATVGAISSTTTGDWAVTNSGGAITAYTGYSVYSASAGSSPNLSGVSSQNWLIGALNGNNEVTTLTNSATVHSIVQQGDLQFNSGVTLTLGDGGLLMRGATSRWLLNVSGSPNSAYLTSGASTGELFVDVPGGTDNNWTIWPIIEDNGATPVILVKNSAGLLKLGNMNTYTGGTIVNAGILCSTAGAEYGFGNAPTGIITPFGYGTITVNNAAELQLGVNVGNAFGEYDYTNNLAINGGYIYEYDAFHHLKGSLTVGSGGVTLGSTYDNKTDALLNGFAKGIFVDGPVIGNGPITAQDSGLNTGNAWNSSTVYFTAPSNTYSGTVTVNSWPASADGGSYLFLVGTDALANATVNVIGDNNAGSGRFGASALIFGSGTNLDGAGYATIGGLSGTGDIGLFDTLVYSSSTGYSNGAPFALMVGNNNASTTYSGSLSGGGSLTKIGTGTLTLSGTETYTGNTVVNGGKLALTGAYVNSTNVIVAKGTTLDVSGLGSPALASGQNLFGSGTINGSISANSGSEIFGDSGSGYGTNAFNNNLTLNAGALVHLSVGTLATGSNDLITVGGTLTANNNIVHVSAPSGSVSLQAADYTLITSANAISGSFVSAPDWDVAPVNANNFSIVVSGNTVKLHYTASTSPTGGGTAAPSPAVRNQSVLFSVTTTNGTGGTVNSVVLNASSIGGSSSVALVSAGGHLWTNSVIVSSNILAGSITLTATITDTASLQGIANIPLNILATNRVWNGAGGNANWGTGQNWTDVMSPGLVGDSIEFAGTTDLSPNMDSSYTITSLLFDLSAGAFDISSSDNSILTLIGSAAITNNSANAQTLNIVIAGTNGLTTGGSGAVNLTASENYTGPTIIDSGALNLSSSLTSTNNVEVGNLAGNAVLNLSGSASVSPYFMLVGNATNSVAAVYQNSGNVDLTADLAYDNLAIGNIAGSFGYYDITSGSISTYGIAIGGEDNGGNGGIGSAGGNGILDINGGSVNDTGWLVINRNGNAQSSILNMYSGSLTYAGGGLVCNWGAGQTSVINVMGGTIAPPFLGTEGVELGSSGILNLIGGMVEGSAAGGNFGATGGQLNFNGGTLEASGNSTNFIYVSAADIYSGGAVINDGQNTVTVQQPLLAPGGNGIYGIASFTGGAGYIAPPIVTIVRGAGDATGTGATAIAQINPATGTVTNVLITCPGQNYTATPTFVLSGGGATVSATITGSAPANNVSGGLTTTGGGTVTLTGASTYMGSTVVSNDTLALAGGGSISDSTNIATLSGSVFDVSALSSYTLASGQTLAGLGNVNGNVTAAAGSYVSAGQGGTLGVNTFNNNLTLSSGANGSMALTTTYNGNNDQIVVSGTLTANNNAIHLQAPSTSSSLDTTADYVLIQAGSISGSFASAPVWDVAPVNAGHFTVVTSGTTVTLHYNASVSSPTVTATASPSTLLRNQLTKVTANVTPGSASISTVKADFTSLGGSVVSLVQSNTSSLWTNTVTVPPTAAAGGDSVTVTATDTANNSGSVGVSLTIVTGNDVWNGAGANANFSTGLNWTNKLAPGYVGDSLEFGTNRTQLSPNVDANYTVTSLAFDTNAGAYNVSSGNASVLTMSGSGAIVNNSTNNQTLNLVVADSGGGITKSGNGAVTLAGNNTYTGPTVVNAGTLNVSGSITAANSATTLGATTGESVLNLTGSGSLEGVNLFVGNASGAVSAVYQTGGTLMLTNGTGDYLNIGNMSGSYGYYDASGGTMTLDGISIGGESNPNVWPPNGSGDGLMEVNGATINNSGWITLARGGGPNIGVLNVYSGSLSYVGGGIGCNWEGSATTYGTNQTSIINIMGGSVTSSSQGVYFRSVDTGIVNLNGSGLLEGTGIGGFGTVNFNGGTLKAATADTLLGVNNAYVYPGGATFDNNGLAVTVGQPLLAPTGNGVQGIASFTGGAGYIAPPIITITNGAGDTTGTGATAIAQINRVTGTVTNIIITCPGVNYTATPIFIVSDGGATTPATITGTAPTANSSGGLTSISAGTLTLTGTNTYTGNTVISNGTVSLSSGASIANSATINVTTAGTFDVSQLSGFVLGAAQMLIGNGTVNGGVTNSGTIAPGSANSLGTLAFNNNLTLNAGGTVSVKLNETLAPGATNDQVECFGTLTYGGTLAVSNPGGVLHVGDNFQLFLTGGSSGNFGSITGSPGAGMAYSFNPSTGILSVVSGSSPVTSLKFTRVPVISGTSLSFSATNSGAGTVYLLTGTNLLTPVSSWTPIWTNALGGSGNFSTNLSHAVKSGAPQQFYILSTTNN